MSTVKTVRRQDPARTLSGLCQDSVRTLSGLCQDCQDRCGRSTNQVFCILHSASASCIGCQFIALGPILHSAFCICILHGVQCTALFGADSMADSAFRANHLLRSANGATRGRRSHIAAPGRA